MQVPAVFAVLYVNSYFPLVLSRWMLNKPGHGIGILEDTGSRRKTTTIKIRQSLAVKCHHMCLELQRPSRASRLEVPYIVKIQQSDDPSSDLPSSRLPSSEKKYGRNLDNDHTAPTHYVSDVEHLR